MEIDLEDMIKNYENRFRELPKLIQNSFEISKENNLQARKVFNQIFKEDRASLMRADAFRSFFFIALSFGLLWAWYTNKIQKFIRII